MPFHIARDTFNTIILILGAQRSGTTWLAKILDSHPGVLYRHEPDEVVPAPAELIDCGLLPLLRRWVETASVRESGGLPFFRKSWQVPRGATLRTGAWYALKTAGRLPILAGLAGAGLPDFALRPPPRLAIKSIRWGKGATVLADTLPDSRTILILRHPCGQVASVMRGNQQRRFDLRTEGTDMPFDEAQAIVHAAAFGISEPEFQALPDAAKYAWSWRAFNEPAYADLGARANVHVVLYEALCANPERLSQRIMEFAGLDWTRQTADFVARSTTYEGAAGYYAIMRNAVAAAERWRETMPEADQGAVRSVVATSPLARFWPDLTE